MCWGDSSTEKDKKDANKDFDDQGNMDKYKNGPIEDRSCTDVFMCILFCLFLLCMVCVSIYGFSAGDPYKIITPFDSEGNICGETEGFEDFKYLYWPEAISSLRSVDTDVYKHTICIKSCPK
jgi:hypothetical protein